MNLSAVQRDLYTLLTTLSATSVERRGLPLLWQREARYLDDDQREMLRKELRFSTSRISELVQAHRSDLSDSDSRLLAYSILAVFSSSSSHRISMPPRQMEALLFDLSARVSLSPIGFADPRRSRCAHRGHLHTRFATRTTTDCGDSTVRRTRVSNGEQRGHRRGLRHDRPERVQPFRYKARHSVHGNHPWFRPT